MVAHTGVCLVHRAEIMQLQGAWECALEEARRAGEGFPSVQGVLNERVCGRRPTGKEIVHRLRASGASPRSRNREASRRGSSRAGLALLRLAEGKRDAAASAMRRVLNEASRAHACACGAASGLRRDHAGRRRRRGGASACRELENISRAHQSDMLRAMSAQAQGALALFEGESHRALVVFREALRAWQELEVPFEAARVRVLVALACRVTGDEDTAAWELDAARSVRPAGAVPDVARVDSPRKSASGCCSWTLAARAAGATPRRRRRNEQVHRRRARA